MKKLKESLTASRAGFHEIHTTPSFDTKFTTTYGYKILNGSSQMVNLLCVIFTRRVSWNSCTLT